MPKYKFEVEVDAQTFNQAEQVMQERIYYDEWYGFDYVVDFTSLNPNEEEE